jgi:hypothetical protein
MGFRFVMLAHCALLACGTSTSGIRCGDGTVEEHGECVPVTSSGGSSGTAGGGSGGEPVAECFDPPGTEILLDDIDKIDPFTQLAVDENSLYLSAMIEGGVYRLDKQGGAAEALASAEASPTGLALSSSHVYWVEWIDGGGVRRVPRAGGEVATLTTTNLEAQPQDVAADDDDAYFVTFERSSASPEGSAGVFRVPATGGEPVQLAALSPGAFRIDVDQDNAYYIDLVTLMRIAKPDGSAETLASAGFSSFKGAMAHDEAAVYLGGGNIVRQPKDGGASSVLASPPDFDVSHLAVDATHVYFSNWQLETIERVAKEGGSSEVFVNCCMNLQPKQFVVDDDYVYWIDGSETAFGALKRAPK